MNDEKKINAEASEENDGGFTLDQWENAGVQPFDLHDVYFEKVVPLVEQLEALTKALGIPYVFAAVPRQETDGCEIAFASSWVSPEKAPREFLAMSMLAAGQGPEGVAAVFRAAMAKHRRSVAVQLENHLKDVTGNQSVHVQVLSVGELFESAAQEIASEDKPEPLH
jgi:hypothetical protein